MLVILLRNTIWRDALCMLLSVCNYAISYPKWRLKHNQERKIMSRYTTLLKSRDLRKCIESISTFSCPEDLKYFTCPCVSCVSWAIVSFTCPCWGRGGCDVVCGCICWGGVPGLVTVFCPELEEAVLVLETAVETGWPLIIWVTTCCVWPVREQFVIKKSVSNISTISTANLWTTTSCNSVLSNKWSKHSSLHINFH